ncbi:MAG: lytic transglycosylase domain-containing protein [Acidobacteria bacterium]|nr:lytic transglycosylase domain-containing protein [Acidobacteriota bacterium]
MPLFQKGIGVCLFLTAVWAADAPPPLAYTVGVDGRTGKLVRVPATRYTRPVSNRSIQSKPVPETVVAARIVSNELTPAKPEPRLAYNVASGPSFDRLIEQVALHYQIHPSFVHAVIKAESNYNPRAISSKGALGLMQLMPYTARRFGVANVFNPVENLEGGVRYLRYLLDYYGGNARLSLAAYNAGEGAVDRFGGVPPYLETMRYVRRVNDLYRRSRETIQVPVTPEPAPKKLEGPRIREILDASGATRFVTESQ